jgi:hypothetical protein
MSNTSYAMFPPVNKLPEECKGTFVQRIRLDSPEFDPHCQHTVITYHPIDGLILNRVRVLEGKCVAIGSPRYLDQDRQGMPVRDLSDEVYDAMYDANLDAVLHSKFQITRCEIVSVQDAKACKFPNWLIRHIQQSTEKGFLDFTRNEQHPFEIIRIPGLPPELSPVPAQPRLSKEDWLRQNYPELSELPKWRFPGMVAA